MTSQTMTSQTTERTGARVLTADQNRPVPSLGHVANRFMIDATDTGGRFALLQHHFEPHALAAPMHRHHDEDEYTFVLTGRIGAVLDEEEVVAGPGDLIFKPRGQWHTFWNAADEPAVVLEIISQAGLEELFKAFQDLDGPPEPQRLAALAARYGCELDFEATFPLVKRHGLVF
jgi:quercetin dioxygenase-like cupin family protein